MKTLLYGILLLALPLVDGALTVWLTLRLGAKPVLLVIALSAGLGLIGDFYCLSRLWRSPSGMARRKTTDHARAAEMSVLFTSLLLFAMPGLVTDLIGFALLTPLIKRRCVSWLSRMNEEAEKEYRQLKKRKTRASSRYIH